MRSPVDDALPPSAVRKPKLKSPPLPVEITEFRRTSKAFVLHPYVIEYLDGDLAAALVYAQVLYWTDGRLSVFQDGAWWLVKSRAQWERELKIGEMRVRIALKLLEKKHLIFVRAFPYGPHRRRVGHIALNLNAFHWLFIRPTQAASRPRAAEG